MYEKEAGPCSELRPGGVEAAEYAFCILVVMHRPFVSRFLKSLLRHKVGLFFVLRCGRRSATSYWNIICSLLMLQVLITISLFWEVARGAFLRFQLY